MLSHPGCQWFVPVGSLTDQVIDSAFANQKQSEKHLAQAQDLEKRKARTSDFSTTKNVTASILSAAGEKALSVTRWKKEDRAKGQEALGYYRDYK